MEHEDGGGADDGAGMAGGRHPQHREPAGTAPAALLNDLVNDAGPGNLAERFGVDRKTLWRWQRAAELPPRLVEALERMLLEREVAAMEEDRQRVAELEGRVSELEGQLAAALAVVNSGGGNIRAADVDATVAGALRREFGRGDSAPGAAAGPDGTGAGRRQWPRRRLREGQGRAPAALRRPGDP